MLDVLIAVLLSVVALVGWLANVLGMPGNWLIVACAVGAAWLGPASGMWTVSWTIVAVIVVIALLGELLEFAASAVGARRLGGSKRGAVLALVGSIAGALIGLFVGSAVPVVGNVIASLLLGGAGAFSGAILGERWAGKDWNASIEIGNAAFWGRLLGTIGKAVCGTIACALFIAAIWL
jgi:uncharacterized protein